MMIAPVKIKLSQENVLFKALLLTLTFSYIFSLKFISFEWMPATRLVFLLCTFSVGINVYYFFKRDIVKNPYYYLVLISVFSYVLVQTILLATDYGMLSKIIVFTVFTLYVAGAATFFFRDVEHFLRVLSICCSFQALMVYVSFFSPGYRDWLSSIMVEGGNIPFSDPFRVPGFSTGSGASLALTISVGVFSSMALYWQTVKLKTKLLYLFASLFMCVSCILVGKLGLFLSVFYILVFFTMSCTNLMHTGYILLSLISILCLIYLSLDIDWESVAYPLERSFSIFLKGEDSTVNALNEMPIPPIDMQTILGTGLASTANGLNASGSDIGYVQTYYGFGLLMSGLFYVSLLLYLMKNIFKIINRDARLLCFVFFVPLFIMELKEPFITKITYPFTLFVLIFLSKKKEYYNFSNENPH
jgi:hypothetical protein